MIAPTRVRAAATTDLPRITSFLRVNGLPINGVEKCLENFVVALDQNGTWIGIAGFERYGQNCLLRSVAVDKQFRGRGYGRTLVETVLSNAKAGGVKTVYLLTEDAKNYFERLGFEAFDRTLVDEPIKASPEFTESYCETAVAMRKVIA